MTVLTRSLFVILLSTGIVSEGNAALQTKQGEPGSAQPASRNEATSVQEPIATDSQEPSQAADAESVAAEPENSPPAAAEPDSGDQSAAVEQQQLVTFNIREFRVTGNTLLDQKELERFLYYRLGENKTAEDVQKTADDLGRLYKDKGFATVVVNIPEQDVTEGIVRLKVIEGKIEQLRIVGSRYHSLSSVRELIPGLQEGNVLYAPEYQSQISQLRQKKPGLEATPILRPGRTPGTVEMELRVKDRLPVSGGIDFNNRYTQGTTATRLGLSLGYDNLWQAAHSLSLQHQMSPGDLDEVKATSATYLWRFRSSDNLLAIYGVRSKSDTLASFGGLSVIGKGTIAGLRFIVPLGNRDNYFHNFILGYDYKNFEDAVGGEQPLPIDYSILSAQYSATVKREQHLTQLSLAANFGVGAVGNEDDEFNDKRYGSEPNFFYMRGSASHSRNLTTEQSLYLLFRTQLSDSPLISNEQQSLGGAETVRAYRESEVLGDNAYLGTVEWRYSPEAVQNLAYVQNQQLYIFVDGGVAERLEPLPEEDRNTALAGAGVGFRVTLWNSLSMYIESATALRTVGGEDQPERIEKGDTRVHYQVEYSF